VRVLAPEPLKRPVNGKASKWFSSVIVHLHGGGFVAMSTCSHQMYSRKWVKQVKAPLFSIDYGKVTTTTNHNIKGGGNLLDLHCIFLLSCSILHFKNNLLK